MRNRVISLILLNSTLAMGFEAAWFDELTPLYPDSQVSEGMREPTLHVPFGTPAGVHLLVTGLPKGASIKLPEVPGGTWCQLIAVPVEENTGLDSRTEVFTGTLNPHVIRRAPFRVYEAILPLQGKPAEADESGTAALRLAVLNDQPFNINVPLAHDGRTIDLRLSHVPHPVTLPGVANQKFHYTNWFSLGNIATRHKVEIWSEAWWEMLDHYAGMMAAGRQNTAWIPLASVFSLNDRGEPVLNRDRLERYAQLFLKHGFHSLEGGHLAGRKDGSWSTRTLVTTLGGHDVGSEQGRAVTASICRQLNAEIIRHGWQQQWLQHISDEPTDPVAESYRMVAEVIRREMPGIPIVDATMAQSLAGAIDVWCPQIQEYQAHRDFFEGRRAMGERIWTYVCLVPGGPWLNRLLDQERLRPVFFGWAGAHYQLDGFLHWGLNHYRQDTDPFEQSVVPHSADNPKNKLPAGDSHILYPGADGPLASVRFEAHHIGMEDHAMLEMLRLKDPEQMTKLIGQVLQSYDSYTTSVPQYRATRLALLQALEAPAPGDRSGDLHWFKGNTHTHSLWSDGNDFPEMITDWYKARGYNFLVLSDHNTLSAGERWMKVTDVEKRKRVPGPPVMTKYIARFGKEWVETRGDEQNEEVRLRTLAEIRPKLEEPGRFLMIEGEEITDYYQSAQIHMNAMNLNKVIAPRHGNSIQDTMRNNLRAVLEEEAQTGRPILPHLNHPNFQWSLTATDIAEVLEERFVEIYNGHPGTHHLGDATRPGDEMNFDIANTLRLTRLKSEPLYAVATDDAHNYHGGDVSPGRGWVMVRAASLQAEDLIKAMRAGDFYASSGVTLKDLSFDATTGELRIEIEPDGDATYETRFIGTLAAEPEDCGKVLDTVSGLVTTYKMTGNELYVRATITSSLAHANPSFKGQLRQAWTQPVGWKKAQP